MGLFNAAANLFGQVYERATQVAATAVTAVADINQDIGGLHRRRRGAAGARSADIGA